MALEQTQAPQLGLLPNPPATQDMDVMGNQTPAAMARTGADVLANPNAAPEDTGQPRISGGASLGNVLSSPHLLKAATSTQKALKANPKLAAQPGGWAKALVGGFIDAMGGGLGDAAAAGTPAPGGGGALTGIARTMQARGQRQAAEREEASKEKTQEGLRAETMMRIAAMTRNVYRQDQEERAAAYAAGDKHMKTMRQDFETREDQDNISQSRLDEMMKKDPDFWKTHTGRAVGEEPVLLGNGKPALDSQGNPSMSPLYSISRTDGMTERKHKITEAESKYMEENGGDKLPAGTEIGLHEWDNAKVRSDSANAFTQKIEKANGEKLSAEKAHQLEADKNDINIQHYMHMVPKDPTGIEGLSQARENAQAHIAELDKMIAAGQQKGQSDTLKAVQGKRQDFVDQTKKIDNVLSSYNEKAQDDYHKWKEEDRKQTETERHDKAEEANKALEVKAKEGGFMGDPNAATPEAFLQSLDPKARSLVQLIGSGKAPLNNPGYLLARKPEILEAVAKAYPDFDISKIKSYQETYSDFTKGKTAVALNAGGTALGHLRELKNLNTAASHIPHTPAWTAYQNKVDTLATELAKFYGDATVPAIASIKETLNSTLPGNRQAAIDTQAQSMGDKLDSFETEWTNAAPSKAYQAAMPGISLKAKQARAALDSAYASQHPELGVKPPTSPNQAAPKDATFAYRDAKGNIVGHAINGKYVPVGAQ